ncbi:MAG: radical SAM protein, partial [Thaumarchaeota archaeon]|nr:radical SAM protein [Nitrososphaerota archaeon]
PAEKWPEVVEDAFAIMHENNIIPAATLILGLPEETPDDVMKTAELLDRLKSYRSLIVPMFFVPMGILKNKDWFTDVKMTDEHTEVMRKCFWHSVKWAEDIIDNFYLKKSRFNPVKYLLKIFLAYARRRVKAVEREMGLRPVEAEAAPIAR